MFNTDLGYLIDEYMVYCRSRQLRENPKNSRCWRKARNFPV